MTTLMTFDQLVKLEISIKSDNFDDFPDAYTIFLEKNLLIISQDNLLFYNMGQKYCVKNNSHTSEPIVILVL